MVRSALLNLVHILFLTFALILHASGQVKEAPACIEEIMQQHKVMGLSVAVVKRMKSSTISHLG